MRIAVTGASGRLGRSLTALLTTRGHEVIALDAVPPGTVPTPAPGTERPVNAEPTTHAGPAPAQAPAPAQGLTPAQGPTPALAPGVAFTQVDLADRDGLIAACAGADVVVHLAAVMSWRRADDPALFAVNVLGTANVAEAAASAGAYLVFASSGEVYPEGRPVYQPLDEDHPRAPTSAYGLTKVLGEDTVAFYRRSRGLRAVVLRFSHFQDAAELLDPGSFFSGPRFFLRRKIEQQRAFGNDAAVAALEPHDDGTEKLLLSRGADGTPYRMGILDSRDLAAGVATAAERPHLDGHTIGVGADDSVDFDDLIPRMAERSGLPYADVRLPGPAVHYTTSNTQARALLDFEVQHPVPTMIDEAARARRERTPTTHP